MPEKTYAMVFAPHPDDEGAAGGTIVRWTREGKDVVLVVCTNGDKGTNDPEIKPEELARIRESEQRAAAEELGIKEIIFLGYPDQTLEDTPEFREKVTRLIRLYQPEVVLTSDSQRRNWSHPDHLTTGRVVLNAVALYARNLYSFPDLYFKEGLELHRVEEVLLWGADEPNYCCDITDTFNGKLAAQNCHKSQFGEPSQERETRMRDRYKAQAENEDFELGESFYRIEIPQPPPRSSEK